MLDCLKPEVIRADIERIFHVLVNNCFNVSLELIELPFKGQAGGELVAQSAKEQVIIVTVPQLEWEWQQIFNTFKYPYQLERLRKEFKGIEPDKWDDCETKVEVMEKNKDYMITWAYNLIMNKLAKIGAYEEQGKEEEKVQKPVKSVKPVNLVKPVKPVKLVKPIHKNKAVVGGVGLAVASAVIHFASVHLPQGVAAFVVAVIATLLALVEHKSYGEVVEEIES